MFKLTIAITSIFAALIVLPSHAEAGSGPVQVFILGGQSNMVGSGGKSEYGRDPNGGPEIPGGLGSLRWFVNNQPATFGFGGTQALVDSNGDFLIRDDVNVYARMEYFKNDPPGAGITRKGNHRVGFGRSDGTQKWIGPEFGMGISIGNATDQDVLLLKVATGGTSLGSDWFSPTAVANRGGTNGYATEPGYMWNHMLSTVSDVLDNLGTQFPEYAGRGHEIAGFGWHQGYNDRGNATWSADYGDNLTDFITDVRNEYGANLPFVIGTTSMFPPEQADNPVELAQRAVGAADPLTTTVDTGGFWRDASISPSNFGYHWNHNGMTHYEIGIAMGEAMVELTTIPEPASLAMGLMGLALLAARRRR
jgi:hypothetical protein